MRRWLIRMVRRTIATPEAYGRLRTALLILQRITRRADEPDLWFFQRLPTREHELIMDVGASGGQSAVALGFIRPRANILSFEPIPVLWPELDRVKRMLGPRFGFRKYALGDAQRRAQLFCPISGRLPITTRAALTEENTRHSCRHLDSEIGLPTSLQAIDVEVRPGDDENLVPTAIKIDTAGSERAVLDGLSRTIEKARPVILIERNSSFMDYVRFFATLDYTVLTHDASGPGEFHLPGLSERNWIAAPRETMQIILQSGSANLKKYG